MAAANSPSDSLRLPPGDLRRRLTTGPSAPAVPSEPMPPVPANSHRLTDLKSRLHTPESVSRDLPKNDAGSDCARITPLPRGLADNNILRRPEPAAQEGSILSELFRTQEPVSAIRPVPVAVAKKAHPTPEVYRGDEGDLADENAQLRQMIQETRLMLEDAAASESESLARETEYQRMIDDLNEQVVQMREQFASFEKQVHSASPARQEDDLEEWANEIEKDSARLSQERRALDVERSQLREDEDALEQQMRTMEVQMARERAVMARQETELKRLSSDIQHELEMMSRGDAALRDQLQKFQRRHQDVLSRGAGGPPPQAPVMTPAPSGIRPMPATGSQPMSGSHPISHTPASGQVPTGPHGSGLLRRLFRPRNEE